MLSAVPLGQVCLVVQDNEFTRRALGTLLQQVGYQVQYASDGRDALQQMRGAAPPVVIITDLWMPVMDGWELLRALQAAPELSRIPVVVVSAEAEAEYLGAAGYLPKPVDVGDLLTLLGRLSSLPCP